MYAILYLQRWHFRRVFERIVVGGMYENVCVLTLLHGIKPGWWKDKCELGELSNAPPSPPMNLYCVRTAASHHLANAAYAITWCAVT